MTASDNMNELTKLTRALLLYAATTNPELLPMRRLAPAPEPLTPDQQKYVDAMRTARTSRKLQSHGKDKS